MLILTNENKTYDLNGIPAEIDDVRYCVFDATDRENTDYYFPPLVFLDAWHSPVAVIELGPHRFHMPLDWSVVACDEDFSSLTVIPLTKLNDRGFHTLVFNPLRHMVPKPYEVNIVNIFGEVKWFFPKIKPGAILVVPVETGDEPQCALFIKDTSKLPDDLDIAELFE